MNTHTLLDRFLRYVRIDTKADEKSTTYPSSPGQLVLGKMLRDELLALGIKDAMQNEHGLVFATVPGNVPGAPDHRLQRPRRYQPRELGQERRPASHPQLPRRRHRAAERPVEGHPRQRRTRSSTP